MVEGRISGPSADLARYLHSRGAGEPPLYLGLPLVATEKAYRRLGQKGREDPRGNY